MKVAVLQANLGNFDRTHEIKEQKTEHEVTFHRWTDENFPPITGLSGRFQYRIPKMFGWQMLPGHDLYIWLDGVISLLRDDSVDYYISQLGDADMAFFHHPFRKSIAAEVDHIEEHLQKGKPYITARYKNGLHKEQLVDIQLDPDFVDDKLWASTTFIYRDSEKVRNALREWWLHQSRYFTCDQVALPYVLWKNGIEVADFNEPIYKTGYMSLVSQHK